MMFEYLLLPGSETFSGEETINFPVVNQDTSSYGQLCDPYIPFFFFFGANSVKD